MDTWSEYLAKLDEDKQKVVLDVLQIAKRYINNHQEAMNYGVPSLTFKGKPVIAVAAHKAHFGIYPFSSKVILAAGPMLDGLETAQGTIRFKYGEFPEDELIKKLVELRLEELK